VYGARAEKPLQNADFATKQTNICRLSGDIKMPQQTITVHCNRQYDSYSSDKRLHLPSTYIRLSEKGKAVFSALPDVARILISLYTSLFHQTW